MENKKGSIDDLIRQAAKKVGAEKENDICRYIPVPTGGYVHHFTMRKMRREEPKLLAEWIKTYVLDVPNPAKVPPKRRAPRGSRKRRDLHSPFSEDDLKRLLSLARMTGDKEIAQKLMARLNRDLPQIKKELIASIKHGRVEPELWNAFVEAVTYQDTLASQVVA